MQDSKKVIKKVLNNGLTVLVHPVKNTTKVSLQLWYHVGSKNEQPSEKGMAHFIEHMIFKGTQSMLSESDINLITQKLSGNANAFTSYDYTGYLFELPVSNWKKVLPVFADCMQHCVFDTEHMNSEVKAVIQELKMYKDDYMRSLAEKMITLIFESHPYHYPIIGYKQDLWNLQRETLLKFYHKYYVPNNATLVVVGDVEPADLFLEVEKHFSSISRGQEVVHPEYIIEDDIVAKSITLYRPVDQATCLLAFKGPAYKERKGFLCDVLGYVLTNSKSAILHQKLVDELGIVASISSFVYDLFDASVFFIYFVPKKEDDIEFISSLIMEEISKIGQAVLDKDDLQRALKLAELDYQHLLEDVDRQAYVVGNGYLALGDENYLFNYSQDDAELVRKDLIDFVARYLRQSLCSVGTVVKIKENDLSYLKMVQAESDNLDTKILKGKERALPVQQGKYVETLVVDKLQISSLPIARRVETDTHGLTVLHYQNDNVGLVDIVVRYKVDQEYDPADKLGLSYIVSQLLLEGTKKYPSSLFIKEAELYGITISSAPGIISMTMLAIDFDKGVELLFEILHNALFEQSVLDRIRSNTQAQMIQFWDTPKKFIGQVAAEYIFKGHPSERMSWGTHQTLEAITLQDCISFYREKITADQTIVVIGGNIAHDQVVKACQKIFKNWNNSPVPSVVYPALSVSKSVVIDIEKQRDQIVMAFVGLSVERMHKDYDALSIYDYILTQGMSSKLFELREQSGLFYTIGGSLVSSSGKQPGMIFVKTIVSQDRMLEAQQAILNCMVTAIDTVTDEEFEQAQEMAINQIAMLFETNYQAVKTLLFLERYHLPNDFYVKRIQAIRAITKEEMIKTVKQYLQKDRLSCVRIGRISADA